jgi:hypothetical protein
VVGFEGTILRTTDGGLHWTMQTSGTTRDLYGVSFIDANTGIVVGTDGTILRTTTGGVTWIEYPQPKPAQLHLEQNYPNPVTSGTTIPFSLMRPEYVSLSVSDVLGKKIIMLVDGEQQPGAHAVHLDASGLTPGICIMMHRTGSAVETRKMLVINP